jgi:hypothetical protein
MSRAVITRCAASVLALAALTCASKASVAAPQIAEGAYRVDWNRKVRDMCVDVFTNEDLTARDWQAVMATQGVLCKLAEVREGKREASWIGRCNQPGAGRVLNIEHRVTVKVNADGSFDLLTVMSGDQQATIPIRGERLKANGGKCSQEHQFLRLWQ